MNYTITFTSSVEKIIAKWKKSNPILFKKLRNILLAIASDPRKGIGRPEPLVGGEGIIWSRHISANDRIIYEINDLEVNVLVIDLEGHYDDK